MKKYFTVYVAYVRKRLAEAKQEELAEILDEHMKKTQFIQHERLIHFLVTMLFAFMLFMSLLIWVMTEQIGFILMVVLMLALLVPYIMHYYFLENTTQEMYKIYDEIIAKTK